MNCPLADIFIIEIDRWPRGVAPLASHIEDLQRKFEMRVLNRYYFVYSFRCSKMCHDCDESSHGTCCAVEKSLQTGDEQVLLSRENECAKNDYYPTLEIILFGVENEKL